MDSQGIFKNQQIFGTIGYVSTILKQNFEDEITYDPLTDKLQINTDALDIHPHHINNNEDNLPEDEYTKYQILLKYQNGSTLTPEGHRHWFNTFYKITPQFFDKFWQDFDQTIPVDDGMFLQKKGGEIVFDTITIADITDFITYLEANYYTITQLNDLLTPVFTDIYTIIGSELRPAINNIQFNLLPLKADITYVDTQDANLQTQITNNYNYSEATYRKIVDSYTITDTDNLLALKLNITDFNTTIANYRTSADQDVIDATFRLISDSYSATQTDTLLTNYILKSDLSLYNTNALLTAALDLKANITYVDAADQDLQDQIDLITSNPANSYNGLSGKPDGTIGKFWYTDGTGTSITNKLYITLSDIDPAYFLFIKDSANTFTSNDLVLSLRKITTTTNDDFVMNIASTKLFRILQATSGNKIEFNATTNDILIQTVGAGDNIGLTSSNNINLTCSSGTNTQSANAHNITRPGSGSNIKINSNNTMEITTNNALMQFTSSNNNQIVFDCGNFEVNSVQTNMSVTAGSNFVVTGTSTSKLALENDIAKIQCLTANAINIQNTSQAITVQNTTGDITIKNTSSTGSISLYSNDMNFFDYDGGVVNAKAQFEMLDNRPLLSFWGGTSATIRNVNLEFNATVTTGPMIIDCRDGSSVASTNCISFRYQGNTISRMLISTGLLVSASDKKKKKEIQNIENVSNQFLQIPFKKFKYKHQKDDKFNYGIVVQDLEENNLTNYNDLIQNCEEEIDICKECKTLFENKNNGKCNCTYQEQHKIFDYNGFTNICLKDVQQLLLEQKNTIQNQQNVINQLTSQLNDVQMKLGKVLQFLGM